MNEKYELFKEHFDKNNLAACELELLITELCNLNCKGYCSEGGPGSKTMTTEMINAIFKPFKAINTLKILGGEPSRALNIVKDIYENIKNREINVNELWVFTNGFDRNLVEKLCEVLADKPTSINKIFLYISRGVFHDQAIRNARKEPKDIDDNVKYYREKFGNVMSVEKQFDEEIPLNVGNARDLNNNPVTVPENRWFILFGENKIQKIVFSPRGYERPDFCNPEEVDKYTFGHVINDGMEKILFNGLKLKK